MRSIDECPPAAGSVILAALDTRIDVSVGGPGGPDVVSQVESAWSLSRALADPSMPSAGVVHVCLGAPVAHVPAGHVHVEDPARALHLLSQSVTMAAITARIGELLMFHGAALSNDQGETLAVVAESGTGKTTFVRTHGAGRHYVSDETVGVDLDGRIVAHPKPLSVIGDTGRLVKSQIRPSESEMLPPVDNARLTGVWLLDRRPDPTPPSIAMVEPLDAIMALAPQISSLGALPRPLHLLHDQLQAVGGLQRVTYSEAADLQPFVDHSLGEVS